MNTANLVIPLSLPVDPLVNMDLTRFVKRISNVSYEEVNPDLRHALHLCGVKITHVLVFYSKPHFRSLIHTDDQVADGAPNWPDQWVSMPKLNWASSEDAVYEWYDIDVPFRIVNAPKLETRVGTPYTDYTASPKTLIKTSRNAGWHLFEAGVPHTADNTTDNHRWNISVNISIDHRRWIPMDELLPYFGDYVS